MQRLIGEQVEAANASLGEAERVRAFAITTRPLDDELTATGTVQRELVLERYATLIEGLYAGPVAAPVA